MKNSLRAAVAQIDITPALPISTAGSLTRREATSIQTNLHARFLMLENQETTLLFVLVDVVGLSNEDMATIRDTISGQLTLPVANICIACTHTHSAPATMDAFTYHRENAYVDALNDNICNTALDLPKKLQPASVAWGTGYEDRPAYNRRFIMQDGTLKTNPGKGNPAIVRPAGPTDPHLPFLAVRDANHNLLSVLASYSLHYIGADSSTAISADYFGEFSRLMQERHGPQCVAMLAHGASGDINNVNAQELPEPWFEHTTKPSEKCTVVAGMLVEQVEKLLPSLQFTNEAVLASSETQVPHGVRKMSGKEQETALQELKDGDPTAQIFAQERLHVQGYPDSIAQPQQCWRVGGWAMCTFPGQMFAQYGLDLQYASPFETTTLVELANAWGGYVGRPMDYVLGGYEMKLARSSFATADTGPKLMESAVGQLEELFGNKWNKTQYTAARLGNLVLKDLDKQILQTFPVWAFDDSREYLLPVLNFDYLPDEFGDLFISANFTTPDGMQLHGYIISCEGSVFALTIFAKSDEFIFNLNLQDLAAEDLRKLQTSLNLPDTKIFPLRYQTQFHYQAGKVLTGVFDPFQWGNNVFEY